MLLFATLILLSACSTNTPKIVMKNTIDKKVDPLSIQMIKDAQNSYTNAKKLEADYFAPVTFSLATKELEKAIEVAEKDYSKSRQINALAISSAENFKKSIRITQMSKEFEKKSFANEDYILWYWNQLKSINEATKIQLDFTKDNSVIVGEISANILTLSQSLEESQSDYTKLTQEYAKLKEQKIIKPQTKIQKVSLYDFAKDILANDKVEVSKKDKGVLLFITGFFFLDKKAELGSKNLDLINKLAKVINYEENLNVEIAVHTDSIGTVLANQKLSQKRAANILKSLANTGSLDTSKITIKAYGEKQPVVSNMLKAGRAKNRRIEVYLHK
jgi:outer membrane protein OmpA-like peptidoglycan-associated protein